MVDRLDGNVYGRDNSCVAVPHATARQSQFDAVIDANAALIAAAPDMLEALETLVAFDDVCEVMGDELTQLVEAAINKAQGRG